MSKRTDKYYGNPPKRERDENGKVVIKKGKKGAQPPDAGGPVDGEPAGDAIPMHVRHADERRGMAHRHETEHGLHDAKGGDKAEMHKRHQHELSAMHKRHAKELGHGEVAGEAGKAKPKSEDHKDKGGEKKEHQEKPETKKE